MANYWAIEAAVSGLDPHKSELGFQGNSLRPNVTNESFPETFSGFKSSVITRGISRGEDSVAAKLFYRRGRRGIIDDLPGQNTKQKQSGHSCASRFTFPLNLIDCCTQEIVKIRVIDAERPPESIPPKPTSNERRTPNAHPFQ